MFFFPHVSSKMHKRWSHFAHTNFDDRNVKLTQQSLFPPLSVSFYLFLLESLLCCFCFLSGHTKFVFPSPVFFTHRVDATQNTVTFQMQIVEWAFLSCQNVNVLRCSFPLFSLFALQAALAGRCNPQAFGLRLSMCSVLLKNIMTLITNKKNINILI